MNDEMSPQRRRGWGGTVYGVRWRWLAAGGVGLVVAAALWLAPLGELVGFVAGVVGLGALGPLYLGLRPLLVALWLRDLSVTVEPTEAAPGERVRARLSFTAGLPVQLAQVEFGLRQFEMWERDPEAPASRSNNERADRYAEQCHVELLEPPEEHLPPRYDPGEDVELHVAFELPADAEPTESRPASEARSRIREWTFWELSAEVQLMRGPDWQSSRQVIVAE